VGNRHFYTCEKDVFEAPDATSWARAMTLHPPATVTIRQYFNDRSQPKTAMECLTPGVPHRAFDMVPDPNDEFTLYIILIGIQAQVCEAREVETLFTPATQREITTLLFAWHHSYVRYRTQHGGSDSPFCLMILWHSIFVSLFSNIKDLEIAFGSHGVKAAADQADSLTNWASTAGAKRAALHVIRIRHLLSRLSLATVPSVHIPRIAFQSAIVCWCYIRFKQISPETSSSAEWDEMAMWTEFPTAGLNAREIQRELWKIRNGWGSDQPLGPFSEILQRLNHWGLAKKLGDILNIAIHEETMR
jgi:hypothetical protein